MRNCSQCKVILKVSQTEGSKTPNVGVPLSPFSFFSPFVKSPGAGVAGTLPVRIISAIFTPLLTAMPAPPAPGKLTIRNHVQ